MEPEVLVVVIQPPEAVVASMQQIDSDTAQWVQQATPKPMAIWAATLKPEAVAAIAMAMVVPVPHRSLVDMDSGTPAATLLLLHIAASVMSLECNITIHMEKMSKPTVVPELSES